MTTSQASSAAGWRLGEAGGKAILLHDVSHQARSNSIIDELRSPDLQFFLDTAQLSWPDKLERRGHETRHVAGTEHDLSKLLAQLLNPGGRIDRGAGDGEVEAARDTDIAIHDDAAMQ